MAVRYEARVGLWLDDSVRAWFDFVTDPDFDQEVYDLSVELEKKWPSEYS
jgi:hypothetical protein